MLRKACRIGGIVVLWVLMVASLAWATSWTTPRTWTTSELVTASIMNTHVRDNLLYLFEQLDLVNKRLTTDTTANSNSGAAATTMTAYAMTAGKLATDGQAVRILAFGRFASNANTKQVLCYFGGTVIATSSASVTYNNMSWEVNATVIRTGAATQKAIGNFMAPDGAATTNNGTYSTPGETLSGAVTIQCQGDGDASNDITQHGLIVEFLG